MLELTQFSWLCCVFLFRCHDVYVGFITICTDCEESWTVLQNREQKDLTYYRILEGTPHCGSIFAVGPQVHHLHHWTKSSYSHVLSYFYTHTSWVGFGFCLIKQKVIPADNQHLTSSVPVPVWLINAHAPVWPPASFSSHGLSTSMFTVRCMTLYVWLAPKRSVLYGDVQCLKGFDHYNVMYFWNNWLNNWNTLWTNKWAPDCKIIDS